MEVLEALLALSLSMVIFSTLVTTIIEAIHRFLAQREEGLRLMMQQFFDIVIWQKLVPEDLAAGAADQDATKNAKKEEFVSAITKTNAGVKERTTRWGRIWQRLVSPPRAQRLTVDEFIRRLAHTEAGQSIASYGDGEIRKIIQSIAQEFVEHGRDARQFFREKARFLSVFVAIGLALIANIDASRLFQQFLREPVVTQALLETEGSVLNEAKAAQKALDEVVAEAITASGSNAARAQERLREARERIRELSSAGLAIGIGYFPLCTWNSVDKACAAPLAHAEAQCEMKGLVLRGQISEHARAALNACLDDHLALGDVIANGGAATLWWLIWVILTGLLIGLGGPFWFDFYANFSRWMNVLRGLKNRQVEVKGRDAVSPTGESDKDPLDFEALLKSFQAEMAVLKLLNR